MEYLRLGQTDLHVSRVGLGCWAIGGHGYGDVDDNTSIAAVRYALDCGINFFDTADVYGFGHSETILGQALQGVSAELIVATKFGMSWDSEGKTYRDCSPERVKSALEASLRRLRTDCIQLYQVHWPDKKTPLDATLEMLERCKEEGKIRYYGCSNFPLKAIHEARCRYNVESLQANYNVIQRDNEHLMSECASKFGMGILAYGTLGRGVLTGKYKSKDVLNRRNDTRYQSKLFSDEVIKKNMRMMEELQHVSTRYGKTCSQVAIRYVLDKPFVTCTIVGAKTREQVSENVGSLGWVLDDDDMHVLESSADRAKLAGPKGKAVFFDRDGVLNNIIPEGEKIRSPRCLEEFHIRAGAEKSVAKLKRAGYMAVVITNQPELSRGLIDEKTLNDIHNQLLSAVPIDEIFICPHDDYHRCACRKPRPGLIIEAASKWNIDLHRSYVIGDTEKDVEASIAANCKPILIDAPYNRNLEVEIRMESITEAVDYILDHEGGVV